MATTTASVCGRARYGDQQHQQQSQDATHLPKPDRPSNPIRVRAHGGNISGTPESLAAAEAFPVVVVAAQSQCKAHPDSSS
jgi:hypothetical protein